MLRATNSPAASVEVHSLVVGPQGSVVVAGTWCGTLACGPTSLDAAEPTVFVAKLTGAGELTWCFPASLAPEFPVRGLALVGDDVLVAAPMYTKGFAPGASAALSVQRLSGKDGSLVWGQRVSGVPVAVATASDGTIVVTGTTFPPATDLPHGTIPARRADTLVVAFAGDGRLLWQKSFGAAQVPILRQQARDSDLDFASPTDAVISANGSAIVTGRFTRRLELASDILTPGGIFVFALGRDGAYRWARRYPPSSQGSNRSLLAAKGNGVLMLHPRGDTADFGQNQARAGAYEITLLNGDGGEEWSRPVTTTERLVHPIMVGSHQDGSIFVAALVQARGRELPLGRLVRLTPDGHATDDTKTVDGQLRAVGDAGGDAIIALCEHPAGAGRHCQTRLERLTGGTKSDAATPG